MQKFELLIRINQIINKYQYKYLALQIIVLRIHFIRIMHKLGLIIGESLPPGESLLYNWHWHNVSEWFRIEIARGDLLMERSALVQRSPTQVNFADWRKS